MKFDPQTFFIGLMEFFSILLPGALLAWLLLPDLLPWVLRDEPAPPEWRVGHWAGFLFAGYLLGHLVFLVGSLLDGLYDVLSRRTLDAQIRKVLREQRVSPWPVRLAVWLVFGDDRRQAVQRVLRVKRELLAPVQGSDAMNAFQWCKIWLQAEHAPSLAVVQRFEADSKFFRCFVVVLAILPFWLASHWQPQWWKWWTATVIVLFLLLALWRYLDQRRKAISQAYWSLLTLAARAGKVSVRKPPPAANLPSHAGGVVYRIRRGKVQYLLVQAKEDAQEWVLPKGHLEEGESPRETAVREVYEETGVWARIVGELEDCSFEVKGLMVTARFHLMEAIGRGWRNERERHRAWLSLDDALRRASHAETCRLFALADSRVRSAPWVSWLQRAVRGGRRRPAGASSRVAAPGPRGTVPRVIERPDPGALASGGAPPVS